MSLGLIVLTRWARRTWIPTWSCIIAIFSILLHTRQGTFASPASLTDSTGTFSTTKLNNPAVNGMAVVTQPLLSLEGQQHYWIFHLLNWDILMNDHWIQSISRSYLEHLCPCCICFLLLQSFKILLMTGLKAVSVTLAAGTIAMIVHSFGCTCCPNCQIWPAEITFEKGLPCFQVGIDWERNLQRRVNPFYKDALQWVK